MQTMYLLDFVLVSREFQGLQDGMGIQGWQVGMGEVGGMECLEYQEGKVTQVSFSNIPGCNIKSKMCN